MHPEIKTERLLLRPLNISDLDAMHKYASDKENTLYMYHFPRNIEETAEFLSSVTKEWEKDMPSFYEFAIESDGKLIGSVSVYLSDDRNIGDLGWILNKKYWNKGYATEAAMAIKNFTLNILQVKKLTANCDCRNIASSRIMEKIGLELESNTGIRIYPRNNESVHELVYSLTV